VACTGVHGANRLASNSLLEGLVFGARAAEAMRRESDVPVKAEALASVPASDLSLPPVEEAIRRLQQQMWEHAGLLRDAELLRSIDLAAATRYADTIPSARWTRREYEARSLARVARRRAAERTIAMIFRSGMMRDSERTRIWPALRSASARCFRRGAGARRNRSRRRYAECGCRAGNSREAAAKIATVPRMTTSDQSVGI
jgi:hypothetical protein